jgi:hypothetical protein
LVTFKDKFRIEAAGRVRCLSSTVAQAQTEATATIQWTAFRQGVADLPSVVTAEVQVAAAATAAALLFVQISRQQCIRTGDQASPTLTRLLNTTLTATAISSLVGFDGQDTSDPDIMATNMVHYWGSIL